MEFLTQFSDQVKNIWPELNKSQKITLISALSIISLGLLLLVVVISTISVDYIPLYTKEFPIKEGIIEISISLRPEENKRWLKIIDLNSLLPTPGRILREVKDDCILEERIRRELP
ncbi:MAG: hypothetical protein QME40_07800 [bacterium]|nr:hypothetical protein [bacterium]